MENMLVYLIHDFLYSLSYWKDAFLRQGMLWRNWLFLKLLFCCRSCKPNIAGLFFNKCCIVFSLLFYLGVYQCCSPFIRYVTIFQQVFRIFWNLYMNIGGAHFITPLLTLSGPGAFRLLFFFLSIQNWVFPF